MSASDRAEVAIVVVSWNQRKRLADCLEALDAQTYAERKVVVVDNGSTDGSGEMVTARFPAARLIRSPSNLGFGAGNNLAIRATDAPYVATLNNDALADPFWLEALMEPMHQDLSLGSVASKMVLQHDPSTIDSCGIALDRAGIAWDLWGGYPESVANRPRPVFGPCAGAALYRRAMLDDVGLFDEDFFAYLEDVDLAWRARLRGWSCVLAPHALVQHAHAGTLGDASPLKRYLLARNKIWTIAKCAPSELLARDLLAITSYDMGAMAFAVARQRDWASVRGRRDGLRSIAGPLRKRRVIQARRTADVGWLRRLYAPLAAPWDVPRRYRHLLADRAQGTGDGGQVPEETKTPVGGFFPRSLPVGDGQGGGVGRARSQARSARELARLAILRAAGCLIAPRAIRRSQHREPIPASVPLSHPRIVIIRPDHLGDVLLSRPAIEGVRVGTGNSADVTVVVGPWAVESLQGLDVRVATFPVPGFTRAPNPASPYTALLAMATRLRSEDYDAALILRPDHWWGALAAALAGIPLRVGHETPETSPFLTHRLTGGRSHAATDALSAAGELLAALGRERPAGLPRVRLDPSAAASLKAGAWVAEHVPTGAPLVAIHPGAGAAVKQWAPPRWATIVDELPTGAVAVLTGGPQDDDLIAAICQRATRPVTAVHNLDWDGLAALYGRADLVLGMDSGPLHLAAAVGTDTVRVYGPTDPAIYGPASGGSDAVVRGNLPCAPCGNLVAPPCGHLLDPPCLAAASVSEVVVAALSRLHTSARS